MSIISPHIAVNAIETVFEDMALSISSFETDKNLELWKTDIILSDNPSRKDIACKVDSICQAFDITMDAPEVRKLEDKDWVAEVQSSFPPLYIGGFLILGSHHDDITPKREDTVIKLDAGAAFGTGEHATTSGCLHAIEWVFKQKASDGDSQIKLRHIESVLDMGCGSAILAMAIAKRYSIPVLAVDIDEVSVEVAKNNIARNTLEKHVTARLSDGYSSEVIKNRAPYNLIVSNILATPLIDMAPSLTSNLSENGIAILSGFLVDQRDDVLNAHEKTGLHLLHEIVIDGWATLILEKIR